MIANLQRMKTKRNMILPYGPEGGIKNTIRSPRAEGEARSPRAKGWYFYSISNLNRTFEKNHYLENFRIDSL